MAHAVFISHAAPDKGVADTLCHALENAGVPCWIAPRDVLAGTRYAEAIVEAIRESQAFVLVFSTAANASAQVEREVDRAASLGLPIVPFRIADVVPSSSLEYYLAGQHWFDALTPPLDEHVAGLVTAVQSLTRATTEEQARPGRPSGDGTAAPHAAPLAASPRQERRVVTTLICDIVGFTAMGEQADPEDVDRLLEEYSARARREIEAHGGTVERSIGDAVVGVFGVPSAHEDDPERAVRAALRLIEDLEGTTCPDGSPLRVRIGINTGEALVRLDADPASGRGSLTGDAVNLAARLQAAAPLGGVAVGALTHELTARAIQYEELPAVTAKGRSEPVAAWLAMAARARVGIVADRDRLTPMVDREVELAFMGALFDKAVAAASPQLALIVGEPGIGKSRLIVELLNQVDARPELVTWRQGRCLPYGEGVTFWALAEILKAHAGILDTDDRDAVEAKLEAVLPEGEDRVWSRQRMRALLGLEAPQVEREENFAAWLRFLEEIAARGPTVLVLEDLHWADDALLAFIEYVASDVADVPLLLVATARPELFEAHPSFAAAGRANRVVLEPLTEGETETLVASLVDKTATDVRAAIARHAEGNPFYAEESARLVRDTVAGRPANGAVAMAATVHAVIAARLDALAPELKATLADASVVGEVFWDGALAALGKRSVEEVNTALRGLIARQLVHRVRATSMAGEHEFAFGHALARDVAYGELPRAVRARKHAAIAAWTESKAGDRADDFAELLAHHYAAALGLARAACEAELVESVAEPALRYLGLAGDRTLALDAAAAERRYARALDLAGAQNPQRPGLLVRWAKALEQGGRFGEAADALKEAIAHLKSAGEVRATATAMMSLARVSVTLGEPGAVDLGSDAVALLDEDDPSPEKVEVLTTWHWLLACRVDPVAALEVIRRAIDMSEQLGLPDSVDALDYRACDRCALGDRGGMEDFRRAFAVAEAQGLGKELSRLHMNYALMLSRIEGPRRSFAANTEGLEFARHRGSQQHVFGLRTALVEDLYRLGEWDEALARAAELAPLLEEAGDVWDLVPLRSEQSLLLAHRGEASEARSFLAWLVEGGRECEVQSPAACSLLTASAAYLGLGDAATALGLLRECEAIPRPPGEPLWVEFLLEGVRTALGAGDRELASRLWDGIEPHNPIGLHVQASVGALLDETGGELSEAASGFADASARWRDFETPYEEAQALLGQGRCLAALGRASEAAQPLREARDIFARLGAKPAQIETEKLLDSPGTGNS